MLAFSPSQNCFFGRRGGRGGRSRLRRAGSPAWGSSWYPSQRRPLSPGSGTCCSDGNHWGSARAQSHPSCDCHQKQVSPAHWLGRPWERGERPWKGCPLLGTRGGASDKDTLLPSEPCPLRRGAKVCPRTELAVCEVVGEGSEQKRVRPRPSLSASSGHLRASVFSQKSTPPAVAGELGSPGSSL